MQVPQAKLAQRRLVRPEAIGHDLFWFNRLISVGPTEVAIAAEAQAVLRATEIHPQQKGQCTVPLTT